MKPATIPVFILIIGLSIPAFVNADDQVDDFYRFEDVLLEEELSYPDWFKPHFGDLSENLRAAAEAGKKGLIVYFGQKRCSYCERFMQVNLHDPATVNYLRRYFDVVAIDIWGIEDIVTPDGDKLTEREYSISENTNFTPSLIFYNEHGEQALRLRGLYPPYQFKAALKYVAEDFYRQESLRRYMARADSGLLFDLDGLNEQDFFVQPPFNFDRSQIKSNIPLVVFFEQGRCHACDVLHTGPFSNGRLRHEVEKLEAAQLDMWSDTPVVTPTGKRTTARQWARELGLFYAPAMIFFDEGGREILRVDAVTQFYRLLGVFGYINRRGYREQPNYQVWQLNQRKLTAGE